MSTIEALNNNQQLGGVRLAATSNQTGTYFNGPTNNGVGATFTYATGVLTIDSVTVNINDYILFEAQSLGYQNGIWQCITAGATGVAAVLQRRGDFQCIEQMRIGAYVFVGAGTVNAGSSFTLVEPAPAAVGVPLVAVANNIVFASTAVASGIGTSAAKAASNATLSTVASTAGSGFTAGNIVTAADTAGTIQDSGYAAATALKQYAQVAMTAAQFNGMYAAPYQLVAAPGANMMIIVDSMQIVMTYGSAAFASGGVVAAQYGATVHGAGPLATNSEAAADFFATASTVFNFATEFGNTVGALPFSTCANAAIYLSNATGAFTTGTGSAFIVKVYYHTISTNS
jgi:hypothetical protein